MLPESRVEPIPPRNWWFKRICAGVAVLLVALGVVRYWWGLKAARVWEAEIAAYRTAGEPLDRKDFDQPPVPDAENAALKLKQAAESLNLGRDQTLLMDSLVGGGSVHPGDIPNLQAMLKAHADALALVRKSRGLPRSQWTIPWETWSDDRIDFSRYSELGKLVILAATLQFQSGDDAAAVSSLRDVLWLDRQLQSIGSILPWLIAINASERATRCIETRVARPLVSSRPAADAVAQAPEQPPFPPLIHDLLDESAERAGVVKSLQRERGMAYQALLDAVNGRLFGRGFTFLVRPMLQLDAVRVLQGCTAYARAAAADSWPEAARQIPAVQRFTWTSQSGARLLSTYLAIDFESTLKESYRKLARRRMAAVALAIRLYERDRGHLPEKLTELAPDYLPVVPVDPITGLEIQYILQPHLELRCASGKTAVIFALSPRMTSSAPEPITP